MDDDDFPPDEDALSETFQRASDFVTFNASAMRQEDLLYLYARYKQTNVGPCKEPIPSILRFRDRSKWSAWNSLGDMSKEEAIKQYIDKITQINPEWDSSKPKETGDQKHFGPVNSSCVNTDPELKDESKTIFDFVKEGNLDKVKTLLEKDSSSRFVLDDDGLSLLHWACDRGHCDIVSLLISLGVNMDAQDNDGQTPLHYASSCGHEKVVKMLINAGANIQVLDSDGQSPADVAYNTSLRDTLTVSEPV